MRHKSNELANGPLLQKGDSLCNEAQCPSEEFHKNLLKIIYKVDIQIVSCYNSQ